jgi:hypothetical protein
LADAANQVLKETHNDPNGPSTKSVLKLGICIIGFLELLDNDEPRKDPTPQDPTPQDPTPATPEADAEAKQVPNPDGRKGGPRHQAYVEDEQRRLTEKYRDNPDLEVITEGKVKGKDGKVRYVDVQVVNTRTGEIVEQVQVGNTTEQGAPVARERSAMEDIDQATGLDTKYRPMDR